MRHGPRGVYLWSRPIAPSNPSVTLSAGYILMLMGRWDWDYVPVPLAFPMASLTVSRVSIETAFVPGWIGYGNALFTWVQFRMWRCAQRGQYHDGSGIGSMSLVSSESV